MLHHPGPSLSEKWKTPTSRWPTADNAATYITHYVYGLKASHSNHELAGKTVYEQSCQYLKQPSPPYILSLTTCLVTHDRLTHSIDLSQSKLPCVLAMHSNCKSFLLLLSFTLTVQSGSSPTSSFHGFELKYVHSSTMKGVNALIWNLP